jgi:uncharacterized protein (DUF2141 family)
MNHRERIVMNDQPGDQAGDLHVIIEDIQDCRREVLLACFNFAEDWMHMDRFFKGASQPCPASGNAAQFTFSNYPHGTDACCFLMDSNANQKMDFNILVYPIEAFAFSNGATGRFGPPDFVEAAFEHSVETRIRISLR